MYLCCFWIIINFGLVSHHFCFGSISKSAQIFVNVAIRRSQASNHQAISISSKTLIEQTRQFRLSIRNHNIRISFWLCKRWNNLSQSKERFVDLDTFLLQLSFVCCINIRQSFWPCQINQLKLWIDDIIRVIDIDLLNCEREHCVRSTWRVIHSVSSHNFVLYTFFKQEHAFIEAFHFKSEQIFNLIGLIVDPFQFQIRNLNVLSFE